MPFPEITVAKNQPIRTVSQSTKYQQLQIDTEASTRHHTRQTPSQWTYKEGSIKSSVVMKVNVGSGDSLLCQICGSDEIRNKQCLRPCDRYRTVVGAPGRSAVTVRSKVFEGWGAEGPQ